MTEVTVNQNISSTCVLESNMKYGTFEPLNNLALKSVDNFDICFCLQMLKQTFYLSNHCIARILHL